MNLARPSQDFINRYGSEVTVIFRVGFMPGTTDNMIKGPQVSQRENRIEYIVRLPFCEIIRARRNTEVASEFLLGAVCCALESLGVDISRISEQAAVLVQAAIEKSV